MAALDLAVNFSKGIEKSFPKCHTENPTLYADQLSQWLFFFFTVISRHQFMNVHLCTYSKSIDTNGPTVDWKSLCNFRTEWEKTPEGQRDKLKNSFRFQIYPVCFTDFPSLSWIREIVQCSILLEIFLVTLQCTI